MKRSLLWLMAAALLFTLLPMAGLAADTLQVDLAKEINLISPVDEQPALTFTNTSPNNVDVTLIVYDEAAKSTVQTLQFTLLQGDAPFVVNTHAYKMLEGNGKLNTYRYQITTAGGYKDTLYFAQIMYVNKDTQEISFVQWHNPIYPRNTVTSFGPQFRVLTPDLTKEWYMFTPIDLTVQGRQSFELVGGNMYNVGEVHVDVNGDNVTVTYQTHYAGETDKVEIISEYLNFFTAYNTITTVNPEELPSQFAYGVPFSIANNLGGDTNVLMFVRNVETWYLFPIPTAELQRNLPNSDENYALRGRMLELMDPIEGVELINEHNYAE